MIKGTTDIYCIFGHPVKHSKSPLMHNAVFQYLDIDACYVAFDIEPAKLDKAIESVRIMNIKGLNITVPHKEAVIPLLDTVDNNAMAIGAVNTIKNNDGKLIGYNTDYEGFISSLKNKNIAIKNRHFLILGAGGASRAIIYGLLIEGARVSIYNRTTEKAVILANSLQSFGHIDIIHNIEETKQYDIIVNTTSLGLKKEDALPIDTSLLYDKHIVYDIIYTSTPLLELAKQRGCSTIDGKDMLIWQAFYAFKIWFHIEPPLSEMIRALYLGN